LALRPRTIALRIRDEDAFSYPGSPWRLPFSGEYMFEVSPRLVNLDEAAFFYYGATAFTPTVAEQVVCEGS